VILSPSETAMPAVSYSIHIARNHDVVVIADFDGALADLYGRLRRALQRWCVEACNEYGWEIPFTQLTLHQAEAANL